MNAKKESAFLKTATLGLFNKKGVSFNLTTSPFNLGGKLVRILIVNAPTTSSGSVARLEISYPTSSDIVKISSDIIMSCGQSKHVYQVVRKKDVSKYLKILLDTSKDVKGNDFSTTNDKVDFYGILNKLSYELFEAEDVFEMTGWKKTIELHKPLGVGYSQLKEEFHIHGGIGVAMNRHNLNGITTSIELATSPSDGKQYVGVVSSITSNPKYQVGMHNGSIEMFIACVLDQYKGATADRRKARSSKLNANHNYNRQGF